MKKKFLFCALLILKLLLFSVSSNRTLRIGINSFPISLNPVYITDETSQGIINKIFDSLFDFGEQGQIKKNLVKGFSYTGKGKGILIELKTDKFFSDGKKLDAKDVLQTYRILTCKKFEYPYQSVFNFIKSMEMIDRFTFKIHLNYKLATWRNMLTFKILNSREIELSNPESFKKKILSGTGPYRIYKVKEPSKIVLTENRFFQPKSDFQFLEYLVISSTHLEPLKLQKGEVDICELQPEDVDAFYHISDWKEKFRILKYKKFGFTYLVFNLKNRLLTKNLRRMFYNRLIAGNFLGRFIKQWGVKIKTPFLFLNESEKPVRLVTRPLRKGIKLKILTNSESKLRKEFVLFLKNELNQSKIILEPLFLEYHTFLTYIKKGNFDLAVSGFLLDIDYDMKDVFYHNAYFNYANFKNARMDQLLDEGLRELDPNKRKNIYLEANKIWLEELPIIPLFNLYYYMGVSRKIRIPDHVCTLMSATGDFLQNILEWKALR